MLLCGGKVELQSIFVTMKYFLRLIFICALFPIILPAYAESLNTSVEYVASEYLFPGGTEKTVDLEKSVNMLVLEVLDGHLHDIQFRVNDDKWGQLKRDDSEDSSFRVFSLPIFKSLDDRVTLRASESLRVRVFGYIIPEHRNLIVSAGLSDESVSRVISRSSWGADENLRIYHPKEVSYIEETEGNGSEGKETNICAPLERAYSSEFAQLSTVVDTHDGKDLIWPIRYSQKVHKIVVHHTASVAKDLNGDDRINAQDYAMQIRGIYNFHAATRKWGDVGYNFLIDPQGNVYEGRAGRDYRRMPVGAHVLCQNTGTVGIALLGNFNDEQVSASQKKSLSQLIADISREYEIDPFGKSSFRGEIMNNVVGHNTIGAVTRRHIGQGGTSCPGTHLDALLPSVIADARNYMTVDYDIVFDDLPEVLTLVPGDKDAVWELRFRNKGTKNLENAVVRLSNGMEAVVGNLRAGETGTATFVFDAGMDAYSKMVNARLYVKGDSSGYKRVGRTALFEVRRDKGYIKISGNPTIVSVSGQVYLGGKTPVTLRYPIKTNANLKAGKLVLGGANALSKRYIYRGENMKDIRAGDIYVDIETIFDVSADVRARKNTSLRVMLEGDGLKLASVGGRFLSTIKVDVYEPPLNSNTLVLRDRMQTLEKETGDAVELSFLFQTSGISRDMLSNLADGDLSVRLTSSNKTLKIEEVLPLALLDDGKTLMVVTSFSSKRPMNTTIEGSLYFGNQRLKDFSGRRTGFVRHVRIKRDADALKSLRE